MYSEGMENRANRVRKSKNTYFEANIQKEKDKYLKMAIPPHVIQRENLRSGQRLHLRIEGIED